jgi:hypothetical protein
MKQHITKNQVNTLSDDAKKKLEKSKITGNYEVACYEDICVPLLSIGQMIQFINENYRDDWSILFGRDIVMAGKQLEEWVHWHKSGNGVCDTLWSICKEILEEDEIHPKGD